MHIKPELGRRIQLHSMDPHCSDITVAVYEQPDESGRPLFIVHSYSHKDEVGKRLEFLAEAMVQLGGMERASGAAHGLRWPCGERHLAATKRLFLEVCKLSMDEALNPRPGTLHDPKLGADVSCTTRGQGRYEIVAEAEGSGVESRLKAICAGYLKLAEMERWQESETGVQFACGMSHDPIMNLLLFRAMNARAALREQDMMASRGVLAAPSAQAQGT
jgi:hypothetical protein